MTCVFLPNVIASTRILRRHQPDEVVGSKNVRQELDKGLLDVVGPCHADATSVEKDDEDAPMRVGCELNGPRRGRRIDPLSLRRRADRDVLEALDLLENAVLRDPEIGGREIIHWQPVVRRIHIDADEVRARLERRRRLGTPRRRLGSWCL
jgi:hypothetical protein